MHHLVMADRQHKVLGERIMQPKGHLVVVVFAVDRVLFHVGQRVVHPAHVPLEAKAKAAVVYRGADARKGGGFLGDGDHAGHLTIGHRVGALQETDGLVILAAPVLVGHPFALFARIIAVKHRGHRIHAQPVNVMLAQPIERVGHQIVRHLGAPVIIDQRVPVGMKPFLAVGMFVKRRAVKLAKPVLIFGEMAGHPVEDQADISRMAGLNKGAELGQRAVANGRRIKANGLIAPGPVKGKFRHRHQLDMREPHVLGIADQLFGMFQVRQRAVAVLWHAPPRPQMDLINRDRLVDPVQRLALGHPTFVGPFMAIQLAHDRGRFGRMFSPKAKRVRLLRQQMTVLVQQLVLIGLALAQTRHKDFPNTGLTALAHRIAPPVPRVEIADDRHTGRVWGPDGKMRARDLFMGHHMGTKNAPEIQMRALGNQVFVQLAQHRAKAIRVISLPHMGAFGDTQTVGKGVLAARRRARKNAGREPLQRQDFAARLGIQHVDGVRFGVVDAHINLALYDMQTKDRKGIAMRARRDLVGVVHQGHVTSSFTLTIHLKSRILRAKSYQHSCGSSGRRRTSPYLLCWPPPSASSARYRGKQRPPHVAHQSSCQSHN
mmetsp:Transcript_28476/g.53356  ORF Transcript_28476/g.53356 Transcript_28476/m.53356 type:complete len:602 (+) Transcript_28476:712-2517(+)